MSNYRCKKLLSAAKDAPFCMSCGNHNSGDVVMAHSNQIVDGKGKGIKAHDFRIAALCGACHFDLDAGARLTKAERVELWEAAHRKTIGWLFESGKVRAV